MSAELKDRHVRPRRSIFLIAVTSFALTLTTLGIAPASAADPIPADGSWQATAEAASATPAELKAEVADGSLNLVVVRDVDGIPTIETAHLTSRIELTEKLADWRADPSVLAIDESKIVRVSSTVNAASVSDQWSLSAISASTTVTGGNGVVVAVIDSGVDASHPDLQGQVINGVDYRDGISFVGSDGLIDSCISYTDNLNPSKPNHPDFGKYDPTGHGTHVAGIIAGKGIGIQGVASGAQIMPIRVIGPSGTGDSSDVACGILFAVENGADVINMSLGGTESDAATAAAVAYAHEQGLVVVAAAGNNADHCTKSLRNLTNYPAAEPNVIGVAAIEPDGTHAGYSTNGPQVDIAAPGSSIRSTYKDNSYAIASGTSMAAPHVSAVAALLLERNPTFTPDQIFNRLTTSAYNPTNAYSQTLGYGIVNASAALTGTRAITQETFSGFKPANLATPACILAEIEQAAAADAARAAAPAPAAPAPAPVAAPVAAPPVAVEVIGISNVVKRKFTLTVDSPAGSKTWIQRKSGKKWVTLKKVNSKSRSVVKVSKSGTYRIQIVGPSRKVISSPFKVK